MQTRARAHSGLASPQDRGQWGQAELPSSPPKLPSRASRHLPVGSPALPLPPPQRSGKQDQLHSFQVPQQNENTGHLVENLLSISRQQRQSTKPHPQLVNTSCRCWGPLLLPGKGHRDQRAASLPGIFSQLQPHTLQKTNPNSTQDTQKTVVGQPLTKASLPVQTDKSKDSGGQIFARLPGSRSWTHATSLAVMHGIP